MREENPRTSGSWRGLGQCPKRRFIVITYKDAGVDVTGLGADSTLSTVGVFAFVDDRGERYLWG